MSPDDEGLDAATDGDRPAGSCDNCGCDLDPDADGPDLCDQCLWWQRQSGLD